MKSLDELNTLIETSQNPKQTFLENIELWKSFYDNRYVLIRNHILNKKLYNIINFLLENEQGEIFAYFHSNLIEILSREQGQLCFKLRNHTPKQEEDINELFALLTYHDEISKNLNRLNIEDIFGDIKKYQSDDLELNIVDALIMSTYKQFFQLEPKLAKKAIEFISKNPTLFHEDPVNKLTMYNDLLFQYLDKLLPLKEFIGDNLNEDNLIQKVKNYKVKNKKIIKKLFKTLPADKIISIFNEDLSELITFLENVNYLDNTEKQVIFNDISNELLNKNEFYYLFDLIVDNNQSNLWKNYLTEENHQQIIHQATSEIPIYLSDKMIKYILEHDYDTPDFIFNLVHLTANQNNALTSILELDKQKIREQLDKKINEKYGSLEKIKKVQITKEDSLEKKAQKSIMYDLQGQMIDFEVALEILAAYFKNQIELTNRSIQPIIRSISTNILQKMGVPLNGVYFFDSTNINGICYDNLQVIGISTNRINQILNKKNSTFNRLLVFSTMFHEMKHSIQDFNKKNGIWDIDTYEMQKEDILKKKDTEFYPTNYLKMKEEIDARISGFEMLSKFLETYFPNLLDIIQDELIANLEKELAFQNKQANSEEVALFSNISTIKNHAFDTIIKYNPKILEENPIFRLEYHDNGTPKTLEEIEISKNNNNQELIEAIIQKRIQTTNKIEKESNLGPKRT